MNSRRNNSRKSVKKHDIESVSVEPGEISRDQAIELLMLNNDERPTSPRHPRESLDSEERVSIPNIDVEVTDKPSSPIIPPNRRKRPIIRRMPATSVTSPMTSSVVNDEIPVGIPPKKNNTPEAYSVKKVSPSIPVGLKPNTPINTPDRLGPIPTPIKPNLPIGTPKVSPSVANHLEYDTLHLTPPSVVVGRSMPSVNYKHTPSPSVRASPSPSVASIKTPSPSVRASPSPSVASIKTPVASPLVRTTPVAPSPSVKTPSPLIKATPTKTPSATVNQSPMTPSSLGSIEPTGTANITETVATPVLLPRGKFKQGPKVVISTIPEDSDEEAEYQYTPGTAVPIRPVNPGTGNTSTGRKGPEPAYVPLPKNKDGIPDYSSLDPVQQAAKWSEFEVKFNILREHNPTYLITLPDRNNETLEEVHVRHREYVKHVAKSEFVDDCVEEYRAYLIIVWGLIELLCSKMLLIPSAGGYFLFQLSRFKKYEGLLVQLGEQGWSESKGKSSSPLWSIIFSSVVTAVVFILVNFLLGSLGNGLSREVSDKAIAFLLGERVDEEEGGLTDIIRQLTGGTGDLGSVIDTIRGMAGFFGGNFAQATQ